MLFQSVTQAAQKKSTGVEPIIFLYSYNNRIWSRDARKNRHRVYPNKLNRLKRVEKLHCLQSQSGHIFWNFPKGQAYSRPHGIGWEKKDNNRTLRQTKRAVTYRGQMKLEALKRCEASVTLSVFINNRPGQRRHFVPPLLCFMSLLWPTQVILEVGVDPVPTFSKQWCGPFELPIVSLSFTCTANVRCKLRISQNRKWADKNSSE